MSSDFVIKVEHLSKCYEIYAQPRDRLKQFIFPAVRRLSGFEPHNYYREFWAIKDVSFEVRKGETVGVIGRNGSGKSTLLQLICGTLNPTSGSIQTNGRIAALLELGSGFNPEFTGRENVYLNGAVLGLSTDEIDARFDEIAAFADIGEFIEQPVKTYSSGMFVRLAFAVNIVSQPDIMIVDEALAVGDMAFQAKCMTALKRIQNGGATILFVSHDAGAIKNLCERGIYLEKGQVRSIGGAPEVAQEYMRVMREEINTEATRASNGGTLDEVPGAVDGRTLKSASVFKTSDEFDSRVAQYRYGTGKAKVCLVEILDREGRPVTSAEFNQPVRLNIHFIVYEDMTVSANYYVQDEKKNPVFGAGLRTVGHSLLQCEVGRKYVVSYTTTLPLHEGNYSVQIQLTKPIVFEESAEFLDVIEDACVFAVRRKIPGRLWALTYVDNEVEIAKE